jgi:uncharacterized protein
MTDHAIQLKTGRLPRHVRALRRLGRTRPGPYQVGYTGGITVPGADGVALLADHYQPLGPGEFPTLLVRSPYGRGFPWASLFGAAYAEQGFHVLLQSCRGTGGSAGELDWFRNEVADGQAAVAWLREQPWFTGRLGTVGLSYLGYVQWALAQDPPAELRAMVVQVGVHDAHQSTFPGGAFALENSLIAGVALVHQGRGAVRYLRAVIRLQRRLARITMSLPLIDAYLPGVGQRVAYLDNALRHPDRTDPYWAGTDLGPAAERLAVPTCLIAGWYDLLLEQNLQQYGRLRGAGCPASLVIGPWTHTSALDKGGPVVLAESLGWLRAHLTGDASGRRRSPVRVHVGGADEWRDLPDWPPPDAVTRELYLHPDGRLEDTPARPDAPVGSFRYDPATPTPSLGGPLLSRGAGVRDNAPLEARADVLTFTTGPLAQPVEVIGAVTAQLSVAGNPGHHVDIFARLCIVDTAGRSHNICDGLVRRPAFVDGDPVTVTVSLSPTAYRFQPGQRIRLQISGGAHPRFARNTGTGEPLATATRLVATDLTLHSGSMLLLSEVDPATLDLLDQPAA